MSIDEFYMNRCIELARLGQGHVAPNPMVGSIIVHEGKIIGEGYHRKFGEAHAEVNAIHSVEDKRLLAESTIYVTLEPCSHFGKTPPCADLLVQHKFKKVVIGSLDPHSAVQGKGIKRLKENNITVEVGCLENACKTLNKHFFTFHEKQRPYVLLKWAETMNGKLDCGNHAGSVTPISSKESKVLVHTLRNEYQAILVGKKTVEHDNPQLTTRVVVGKNPIRVVLDSELQLNLNHAVFDNSSRTIVLNVIKTERKEHIEFVQLPNMSTQSILNALFDLKIISVMVEGGLQTLNSFIEANHWDEAILLKSKVVCDQGTDAPIINQPINHSFEYFGDTISVYSKIN